MDGHAASLPGCALVPIRAVVFPYNALCSALHVPDPGALRLLVLQTFLLPIII